RDQPINQIRTEQATIAANDICQCLTIDSTSTVKELPFEFMPGYYFFVGRKRAIVVAPLNLPFPKGAPQVQQEGLPTVQMIGFETNDRGIIHDLQVLYRTYRRLPSAFIAKVTEVVKTSEVEASNGPSHQLQSTVELMLNKLIQEFKKSKTGEDY